MQMDELLQKVQAVMMAKELASNNDDEKIKELVGKIDEVLVGERQGEAVMAVINMLALLCSRFSEDRSDDDAKALTEAVCLLVECARDFYSAKRREAKNAA